MTDSTDLDAPHVNQALATDVAHHHHTSLTPVPEVNRCSVSQCPHPIQLPGDGVILAWLDEKTGKSHSWKTHVAYHSDALAVRAALREHGYDLFVDLSDDAVYASYLLIVQRWAGSRMPTSHLKGEIAPATYNRRLACISSLFEYAKRMRLYRGDNPIDAIQRRTVGDQQGAQAIDMIEMRRKLASIDRTTDAGRRDYTLMCVALATAQRGQALADMRIGDLTWSGDKLSIHFPRTKGGETDDRELEVDTSTVLADYLRHQYGDLWEKERSAPIWISFANNDSYGKKLSIQAIGQIYAKYLRTSKSHVLRHTAGLALDDLGAPTSETQRFFRHKNLATTDVYLKRQKKKRNKYGRDLEQVFGITARPEDVQE